MLSAGGPARRSPRHTLDADNVSPHGRIGAGATGRPYGPCAAGMELEAFRARNATPTLFEEHDERHDADDDAA